MRDKFRRDGSLAGFVAKAAPLLNLYAMFWFGCAEVPVPDPSVRYIAFGDSSTAGPSERDYCDILRELLAEPTEAFVNQGVGGEAASDGLQRLRSLLDQGIYPNAHTLFYWEGGTQIIELIAEVDPLLLLGPEGAGYPYSRRLNQALDDIQGRIEAAIETAHGGGLTVYVATYFMIPQFFLPAIGYFWTRCSPGKPTMPTLILHCSTTGYGRRRSGSQLFLLTSRRSRSFPGMPTTSWTATI